MQRFKNVVPLLIDMLPIDCDNAEKISEIKCLENIQKACFSIFDEYGYEYVSYTYWLKSVNKVEDERNVYTYSFGNFPEQWISSYERERLHLIDPVARMIREKSSTSHIIHNTWDNAYRLAIASPLGSCDADKQAYIEKVNDFNRHAKQHGLNDGHYYLWGCRKRFIVLKLATSRTRQLIDTQFNNQFLKGLHGTVVLINQSIMMTRSCSLCSKVVSVNGNEPVELSRQEIDILKLYMDNKNASTREISQLYSRSLDTINYHLRSLRIKLELPGASGHALAAAAVELGII